jgi:hypothetical protein
MLPFYRSSNPIQEVRNTSLMHLFYSLISVASATISYNGKGKQVVLGRYPSQRER